MLNDIREFGTMIFVERGKLFGMAGIPGGASWYEGGSTIAEGLYCPTCGDTRRANIRALYFPFKGEEAGLTRRTSTPPLPRNAFPSDAEHKRHISQEIDEAVNHIIKQLIPSVFLISCVQCDTQFTAMIYQGPEGPALAMLPSTPGGITTPHTPPLVTYYLDQAHRAELLGAHTAAVAMLRAALESLLQDQGFAARMLGPKLSELEVAIAAKKAPQWALDLDTEFLKVIKDVGNSSIHTSDDDMTKKVAIDRDLVLRVSQTFQMLLYLVYEVPARKNEMLDALKIKAQVLKK